MNELKIIEKKKLMVIASRLTNSRIVATQVLFWLFVHDNGYWQLHKANNSIKWVHENIHFRQGKELGFIFFWLLYFINWFVNLFIYRDLKKAYKNIVFEKEAYYCDGLLNYLSNRKKYAWLKWVF